MTKYFGSTDTGCLACSDLSRFATAVIDSLSAHICVVDEHGAIIAVNRAWREFAAANQPVTTNVNEGANYLSICEGASGPSSEEAPAFAEGIRKVARGELQLFSLEYPCHSPDQKRWFSGRVTRLSGAGPAYMVISHENITERKKAEERAIRSRDYYLSLFESFPALIWRSGTDGKCDYFNRMWLDFTGRTLEEEAGDGWAEGVHPDDLERCVGIYLRAFNERVSFDMEYRLRRYDGSYRWIIDHGRAYYDLDGDFAGYIGSCYDINDKKEAELALKQAHCALEVAVRQQTEQLLDTSVKLEQEMAERREIQEKLVEAKRLEAVGQIAGGVAHEVRNPLNAILMITEALFREDEVAANKDLEPYVEHIRTQVGRLSQLMKDLLQLGKPIPAASLQPVHLLSCCTEAVALLSTSDGGRNRNVGCRLEGTANVHVLADQLKLQQIVLNLLENAVQHSPQGTEVLLSARAAAGMAVITVVDHGKGIAPEKLGLVFEPFFTERKGGTGLGLALVKHFTEHMGGGVTIRNNIPAPGCTVEVTIPLYQGGDI